MEQRNQMTIVERALAMMVKNGEAKQHTVSIELDDGGVKDISFYKLTKPLIQSAPPKSARLQAD